MTTQSPKYHKRGIKGWAYRNAQNNEENPNLLSWSELVSAHTSGSLVGIPVLDNHNESAVIGCVMQSELDPETHSLSVTIALYDNPVARNVLKNVAVGFDIIPKEGDAVEYRGLSIRHNRDTRQITEISVCKSKTNNAHTLYV